LELANTSSITSAARHVHAKKRTTVIVFQAFRYELDPNNAQRSALASHAGAARYAWNWGLARVKEALDARRAVSPQDLGGRETPVEREALAPPATAV